jgi:hypothetical protein
MKHPMRALSTAIALRCVIVLLLAFNASAPAQDNAPTAPAAADTPAQTDMQKWIAATDAQWQAACQRDVTDVHEAEAKKLMLQYLNLLEDAIGKASKASDLDGAVALRTEQKRFGDTQLFPEEDQPDDPAAVKQARAGIRALLAKLKMETAARTKALYAKYDQLLAQAQTQLTQVQRLDDALLVKAKRAEVEAAWITPAVAIAAADAAAAQAPKAPATPPKVPLSPKAGTMTSSPTSPVGTWRFQIKDKGYVRTFHEDGTITGDGFEGSGKWRIAPGKIIISYPSRGVGWLALPLNSKGTKGQSHNGEPQTVTKIGP